jgi:TorA maturation chaperone TorD
VGKKSSQAENDEEIWALREAIDEDLNLLGFLHAKELDPEAFASLRSSSFSQRLGIVLSSERALEALRVMDAGLSMELEQEGEDSLEELACDYAGIYLTHQCGVSPCESPWRDEDHLERQQPMFEVREWYKKYGMAAKDWRKRPDDHLSTQLAFAAHLIGDQQVDLKEIGRFFDQHLLLWIGDFAEKVAGRCATPFYAGLSMLTYAYLTELRDMIEALTGLPRPPSKEEGAEKDKERLQDEFEAAFVPGTGGPGW